MGLANEKVGGIRKSSPAYLRKMPYLRGASLTVNDNVAGASRAKRKKRKRKRKTRKRGHKGTKEPAVCCVADAGVPDHYPRYHATLLRLD